MPDEKTPPFHLAFPVDDLEAAEQFYAGTLGCATGRRSDQWIDFDFFGHQIVAHLVTEMPQESHFTHVDGHEVPARHFGAVLNKTRWQESLENLRAAGAPFLLEPMLRFAGQTGEQGTFFVLDPAGNALEFKYFDNLEQLFSA